MRVDQSIISAHSRAVSARQGRHREPGSTLCWADRSPPWSRGSSIGAAEVVERDADFGVRRTAAHGWARATVHAVGGPTACTWPAPSAAYQADNAAAALPRRMLPRPSGRRRSVGCVPGRSITRPAGVVWLLATWCSGLRAHVAGAQALHRAGGGVFPGPRTLVIRLLRENAPHEMLEGAGRSALGAAPVLPAADALVALDLPSVAGAGADVGVDPARIATCSTPSTTRWPELAPSLARTPQIVVTARWVTRSARPPRARARSSDTSGRRRTRVLPPMIDRTSFPSPARRGRARPRRRDRRRLERRGSRSVAMDCANSRRPLRRSLRTSRNGNRSSRAR